MGAPFTLPPERVTQVSDGISSFLIHDSSQIAILSSTGSFTVRLDPEFRQRNFLLRPSSGAVSFQSDQTVALDTEMVLETGPAVSLADSVLIATISWPGSLTLLPWGQSPEPIRISGQDISYGAAKIGALTFPSVSTLRVTFNTNATSASVQAILRSVAYHGTSLDPFPVEFHLVDSTGNARARAVVTAMAIPQVTLGASATNVPLGSALDLSANIAGSFFSLEWRLNGIPIRFPTN